MPLLMKLLVQRIALGLLLLLLVLPLLHAAHDDYYYDYHCYC